MKKILKKLSIISLLLLAFSLTLTGCGEEVSIVGTWTGTDPDGDDIQFVFNEDGTYEQTYPDYPGMLFYGEYETDGDELLMSGGTFTFKISGAKLTLTNLVTDVKYELTRSSSRSSDGDNSSDFDLSGWNGTYYSSWNEIYLEISVDDGEMYYRFSDEEMDFIMNGFFYEISGNKVEDEDYSFTLDEDGDVIITVYNDEYEDFDGVYIRR